MNVSDEYFRVVIRKLNKLYGPEINAGMKNNANESLDPSAGFPQGQGTERGNSSVAIGERRLILFEHFILYTTIAEIGD